MPSKSELKADRDFVAYQRRLASSLLYLDQVGEGGMFEDMQLREIRVRANTDGSPGFLVVVKAHFEGREMVGFSQGMTVTESLSSAAERIRNNSLKWREDKPWNP